MSIEVIEGLSPKTLWQRFYEISQIPRPPKKEEKALKYLKETGRELNLEIKEDDFGNIVMLVPAIPGYENTQPVVIQSHVDMVCEKNKNRVHDFDRDPIKLVRDLDWIRADGTTLGADNGIGVSACLAVASDKEVTHGPLELLFTVQEEIGLTGASHLEPRFIKGKTLLNLDSEEGTSFYVGCAGGQDTVGIAKVASTGSSGKMVAYDLLITGLKGGHSGLDIHRGRANAIKILGRLLKRLQVINYQAVEMKGGSKRNVIPREAEATILVGPSDVTMAEKTIKEFHEDVLAEYEKNDGGVSIEFRENRKGFDEVFTKDFLSKLIHLILALPHGVIAMSTEITDLVETSTNLATIVMGNSEITVETSQRSSIESARDYAAECNASVFKLAGAKVLHGGGYPAWKPNLDSEILKISKKVYRDLFKEDPEVKAIHAGLECGILRDKYPGLDIISFGPTIQGAHSPDERVHIQDVEKFYNLLKSILLELAK